MQYLYPSMIQQGIADSDICIYEDKAGRGVVKAYIDSITKHCTGTGGTWHMQDDIIISSTFKQEAEGAGRVKGHDVIACGIRTYYDFWDITGITDTDHMWYSFPCIYIPDHIAREFVAWIRHTNDKQARECKLTGRGIDWLFRLFLRDKYHDIDVINAYPNICNHVDYLIGGSSLGVDRETACVAKYWTEPELVDKLKDDLVRDKFF